MKMFVDDREIVAVEVTSSKLRSGWKLAKEMRDCFRLVSAEWETFLGVRFSQVGYLIK